MSETIYFAAALVAIFSLIGWIMSGMRKTGNHGNNPGGPDTGVGP
jgi:hypothetical protein